jgi:flagellar protein FliO/FliZ
MIGGPSDVVVETNIMRAAAATQREGATPRVSVDALPRAVPLPDATNWPLQPEPALAPRAERPRMISDEPVPMAPPPPQIPMPMRAMSEPQARPPSPTDPLIGLAAELSRSKFDTTPRPPEPPRIPLTANYSNADTPIAAVAPATTVSADVHLAEMAQRLETALRRPLPLGPQGAAGSQRPTAANDPKRMETKAFSAAPANGNGAPTNSIYEDLEQEMASLLGRQSGKT